MVAALGKCKNGRMGAYGLNWQNFVKSGIRFAIYDKITLGKNLRLLGQFRNLRFSTEPHPSYMECMGSPVESRTIWIWPFKKAKAENLPRWNWNMIFFKMNMCVNFLVIKKAIDLVTSFYNFMTELTKMINFVISRLIETIFCFM